MSSVKMFLINVSLCVLFSVYATQAKGLPPMAHGAGYHWRSYDGPIPPDALPASPHNYIGQVFVGGAIVPANINSLEQQAEFIHNNNYYTTKDHVKILCSSDPSQFEWVKTDSSELTRLLPYRRIISGGRLNNNPLIVGRSHDNHVVGAVTLFAKKDGLHYPRNVNAQFDDEFDVFAYKRN